MKTLFGVHAQVSCGSSKSTKKPSDYCSYCELPWQYIAWHCIFCSVLEGSYVLARIHVCVQNGLSNRWSMSTPKVLPSDYVVDSCGAIVIYIVGQIVPPYRDEAFSWTPWSYLGLCSYAECSNLHLGVMWNANDLLRPLKADSNL